MTGEGEVDGIHGVHAEEFADEESAAFAVEGADVVGFVECGEEGGKGAGMEVDVMRVGELG